MLRKLVLIILVVFVGVEISPAQDDLLEVIVRSARSVKIRPSLVLAVIYVESRGKPTALDFNLPHGVSIPKFPQDVESSLKELWAMPKNNVDIGLMQVNCKYWCKGLGLSKEDLLKSDVNIAAGTAILAHHVAQDGEYQGVGHYHSYTPDKAKVYADTVLKIEKIISTHWTALGRPQ